MKIDSSVLHRWRIARRVTLGAIVIAGTMATAAVVVQRMAMSPWDHACSRGSMGQGHYTYSGIGVELEQRGDDFVVRRVFPGSPADGKLFPNAELISVNGESPEHMQQWTNEIRGEQGTSVTLEVEYPCSGRETVTLERDIVRVRY
jgi:C-terminal processing protease CtpA/Prc